MATTSRMKDAGQDGRIRIEPQSTNSSDTHRHGPGPVEVPPIELHSNVTKKQIFVVERQVLDGFESLHKRTREMVSYVKRRTGHLFENYPMQTIAGIAGIAFTVGLLLRVTRSNYE